MIDLITVIPIWFSDRNNHAHLDDIKTFRDGMEYFLFCLATTRILRALRLRKTLTRIADPVQRFLGEILVLLLIMILFSK